MSPPLLPLRLHPGDDLRQGIERACARHAIDGGFVVAGIGSLIDARLRLADAADATLIPGPAEILTLCGSVAENGTHLHMSIATASGQVIGGHVAAGNRVRTTVELVIAALPEWSLRREHDAATGYDEWVVRERKQP